MSTNKRGEDRGGVPPAGTVEVITRYQPGKEDKYSVDGGKTFLTKEEFQKRSPQPNLKAKETQL